MDDSIMIHDFNQDSQKEWRIVDDVVMGGRSEGLFTVSEEGHGIFYGSVSLENYGGFSSVRMRIGDIDVSGHRSFVIRIKGDGKSFQFRAKPTVYQRYSYIGTFETSGEWQEITIDVDDMYPAFRGRRLDMPHYSAEQLSEIAFLISNKRAEHFRLEIDWVKMI